MTASYLDFEPVPDDNQSAPPIGAPEGNYKGSNVNNTFRNIMAAMRNLGDETIKIISDTVDVGTRRLVHVLAGTASTDAVNVEQMQGGAPLWGGVSGGSANAQTITLVPAITAYVAGLRIIFYPGFVPTGPTTINVNTLGPRTLRRRNGSSAVTGCFATNDLAEIVYNGSDFILFQDRGFMDQALYNKIFPLGFIQIRHNDANPNDDIPHGVQATWTHNTTGNMLFPAINSTLAVGLSGGSSVTSPAGAHGHAISGTTGGPSINALVTLNAGGGPVAGAGHVHSVTGSTDVQGAHQHSYDTPFVVFRWWTRTT